MIDPLTALSVAAGAVSSVKQLMAAGQDATAALSKFAGAVSDVNYAANKARNPSIFATLSGSAEEEAINAFSAQKKMQEYRRELETLIAFQYGPKGLEEYKNTLRAVREQRRQTAYRQAEIKEAVTMWTIAVLVGLSGLAGLALIAWAIGRAEGRW